MENEKLAQEAAKILSSFKHSHHHKKHNHGGHKAILFYLEKNGGNALSGEISKATGISTPRLAYILKELEEEGFLTRKPSELDHRKVCVTLSECGKKHIEHKHVHTLKFLNKLFSQLSEQDIEAFFRILNIIKEIEDIENEDLRDD